MIIVIQFLLFLIIILFPKKFAKEKDETGSGNFNLDVKSKMTNYSDSFETSVSLLQTANNFFSEFSRNIQRIEANAEKIDLKLDSLTVYLNTINKRLDGLEERTTRLETSVSLESEQENKGKDSIGLRLLSKLQKLEKIINSSTDAIKYINKTLNGSLSNIIQKEKNRNIIEEISSIKTIIKNHSNITITLLQHLIDKNLDYNLIYFKNITERIENKLLNITFFIQSENKKIENIFYKLSNNLEKANLHIFAIKVFNVLPEVKSYTDVLREAFASPTDVSTISDSHHLGSFCTTHFQCSSATEWSACVNEKCTCPYGEITNEKGIQCRQQPYLGRTCSEIRHNGFLKSDYYLLYPYGPCNDSVQVFCNMTFPGITIIFHNYLGAHNITGPIPGNYYYATLTYTVDNDVIEKIISLSTECHQFVNFSCGDNSMIKGLGHDFAPWRSRQGKWQNNWGGAPVDNGKCACGMNNSCNHKAVCNCNNIAKNGVDEGYLTDKDFLPVSAIQFGDLDDSDEYAFHVIGPLECSGW